MRDLQADSRHPRRFTPDKYRAADPEAVTGNLEGHVGSTVRFVVLRHEDHDGVHFDLMIETNGILATWKCPVEPELAGRRPIECRRIADHRRAYLNYEGPISGDRGEVIRHDEGEVVLRRIEAQRWLLGFAGRLLCGDFLLDRNGPEDHSWSLRRVEA